VQSKSPTLPPGLLDRLRAAFVAARPARFAAPGQPPDVPAGSEGSPGVPAAPEAAFFVSVFGLSTAALEEVLEAVIREGRGSPVSPVFLTDSLDFEPFSARGLRFEYLPDGGRRQRFAPDLDWRAYERRRYRLLVEKWRPQSLISFGTPPPPDCAAAIERAA
jgi:hypothetical protein